MSNQNDICECDIFDFMATHVGLTVIHPGGLKATSTLAEACEIGKNTRVVDIACGKGTSAAYFVQMCGCEVIGVDISEALIAQARSLAKRKGLQDRVAFQVGDALNLPFPDNKFDVAISQAMLVLVGNKRKAIQEALQVTKPGGSLGWLELSLEETTDRRVFGGSLECDLRPLHAERSHLSRVGSSLQQRGSH